MPYNTSETGGPLWPGPGRYQYEFTLASDPAYWMDAAPEEGQELEDFFQQMVAGITGLAGSHVFPLWQEEPAAKPAHGDNWMAVGLVDNELLPGFAYELYDTPLAVHVPVDDEGNPLGLGYQQHETFDLLCICYGPRADWFDGLIRDGFSIGQNNALLFLAGMGLVQVGRKVFAPEIIQNRWIRRVDRRITIRRIIRRFYPILNVLSGGGTIYTS